MLAPMGKGADDLPDASASAAVGRRVRELRVRLGLTQADLAGDRYSAAYISTIETGRRRASGAILRYLAERLGVDVADLAGERAAGWALEMARDLRSGGHQRAARDLLERSLESLERSGQLAPRVLVVMHREIGLSQRDDLGEAERHLLKAVEYGLQGGVPAIELALTYVELGDLQVELGHDREALSAYRAAASVLLELHRPGPGRSS